MHQLAADTEIVTRDGIRQVAALAGTTPAVLVPKRTTFGLSTEGSFKPAPVVALGAAELLRVELVRGGKQRRTVTVAAGQRWLAVERYTRPATSMRRGGGYEIRTVERGTTELVAGEKLRTVRANRPGVTGRVPFAIAQGFVFGDGGRASGDRPGMLRIYDEGKDGAIFPYFAAHDIKHVTGNGKPAREIYGLPRTWKDLPPVDESRAFLLSWLAGYFAADGNLTVSGTARLSSATREHLEFARGVAAICGIGYGAIRSEMRVGFPGRRPSPLYMISLTARTLPDWFLLIDAHRKRNEHLAAGRMPDGKVWAVRSVEPAGRGDVFAVDTGALALAEDLMIGAA